MEQTHSHPFHFRNEAHKLTKTETKIARYILENLQRIPAWSIEQLSRELKTSTATISRFARALGYESYKDLKNDIAIHTTYTPEDKIRQSISKNSDIHKDLFQREAVNIGITATLLDYKTLNNASSSILNGEKIYIYAKGASISLVHLLAFRLRRFGITVIPLISGGSEIFEYLVHITENDVFIVIGFGNVPLELDIILGECLDKKCSSIYITDSKT
jgi:DNA-binding MurR/RpiR family transcriptional regulator